MQNLITQKKVRIKCKDIVRSIALYQNKIAIQLSDKICVYECETGDDTDMHYRLRKDKIALQSHSVERVLLTSSHLLLLKADVIELYTFDCVRYRVWQLESLATCICPGGGLNGSESFFIGCTDGSIVRLFIDNAFLTEVGKCQHSLVGIDVSADRMKLACVDALGSLMVMEIKSQRIVYAATNVSSVYFNSEINDMICFCTSNTIIIGGGNQFVQVVLCSSSDGQPSSNDSGTSNKTTGIIPQEVEVSGRVVGFRGRQILSRCEGALLSTEVSQSVNIARAVQQGNFLMAHQLACLAGTENDWRSLAMKAMRASELEIAKKCFTRLRDVKFLTFIDWVSKGHVASGSSVDKKEKDRSLMTLSHSSPKIDMNPVWYAELLAIENLPLEAAKAYNRMNRPQEAIRVLTDLRMYTEAKAFSQSMGLDVATQSELVSQQAAWLQEIRDWQGAADLYISLGFLLRGAKLIGEYELSGWDDKLLELIKEAPADTNSELLVYCAEKFVSKGKLNNAMETYKKLGDVYRLVELYATCQMWKEATDLAERQPGKFDPAHFVPHARWLANNARYDEAVEAFTRAGRPDLAFKILKQLLMTSIFGSDFRNASHYSWKIARYMDETHCIGNSEEWDLKSNIYYAYASLVDSSSPTTSGSKTSIGRYFQSSLFILNLLGDFKERFTNEVHGVSEAIVLCMLGREATALGAYKLAQHVYERLSNLRVPVGLEDEVEMNTMVLLTKPLIDDRELLPLCYRCGSINPLLNPCTTGKQRTGDCCTQCGHIFVRSFTNFEILPLVELLPQQGISDESAIELIRQGSPIITEESAHLEHLDEGKIKYDSKTRMTDVRFKEYLDRDIDSQVCSTSCSSSSACLHIYISDDI